MTEPLVLLFRIASSWMVLFTIVTIPVAALDTPRIQSGEAQTQHLVNWAKQAVKHAQNPKVKFSWQGPGHFEAILEHLKDVKGTAALKNLSFHSDRQKITTMYWDYLYFSGKQNLKKLKDTEIKKIILTFKKQKAPSEYHLPFYLKLRNWEKYYSTYKENLILFSSYPDRLRHGLKIPPTLHIPTDQDADVLLDILSILDMCMQQGWKAAPKTEEKLAMTLAQKLEQQNKPSYALSALSLVPPERRSKAIKAEFMRLQKHTSKNDNSEELY